MKCRIDASFILTVLSWWLFGGVGVGITVMVLVIILNISSCKSKTSTL